MSLFTVETWAFLLKRKPPKDTEWSGINDMVTDRILGGMRNINFMEVDHVCDVSNISVVRARARVCYVV